MPPNLYPRRVALRVGRSVIIQDQILGWTVTTDPHSYPYVHGHAITEVKVWMPGFEVVYRGNEARDLLAYLEQTTTLIDVPRGEG